MINKSHESETLNYSKHLTKEDLVQLISERNIKIEELVKLYGSFNIIANSFVFHAFNNYSRPQNEYLQKSPAVPEYLALICLKYPFSPGNNEFSRTRDVSSDMYELNRLGSEVVMFHSWLHRMQFEVVDQQGTYSESQHIAAQISSEELLVRNETFEEHHWQRLETLYEPYNSYFKQKLGFDVQDAIALCQSIQEYCEDQATKVISGAQKHAEQMYREILDYKYKNKLTINPYPPEFLERFKKTPDHILKSEFIHSMNNYSTVLMGHQLCFDVNTLSERESMESEAVEKFLNHLSLSFGDVEESFKNPEILHPLKNKPLIHHEGKYLCVSLYLLDYSLDRLFANTLQNDPKKADKYKHHRHNYLLEQGMGYLQSVLKGDCYTNLLYESGELDGLIFCGHNAFFIEAKSHRISDRAKRGFLDRIMNHVEDIVVDSHFQAVRTYNYLKGKSHVEFRTPQGRKVYIDGTRFKNAYFISLSLEGFKAVSCSLKVGNSLGLFDQHTFPWIVSLYDLRVICEHMEGPAYLIQYIHRRREFFKISRFIFDDELDLLAYYLKYNLRLDDLLKKYRDQPGYLKLPAEGQIFNDFYENTGKTRISRQKLLHNSTAQVKELVTALEESQLENSIDAAVQILEFSTTTRRKLFEFKNTLKKKYRKDKRLHDSRLGGDEDSEEGAWMFSYWVGPDDLSSIDFFVQTVFKQFRSTSVADFFAIYDSGDSSYHFKKIIHFSRIK